MLCTPLAEVPVPTAVDSGSSACAPPPTAVAATPSAWVVCSRLPTMKPFSSYSYTVAVLPIAVAEVPTAVASVPTALAWSPLATAPLPSAAAPRPAAVLVEPTAVV